MATKRIARSVRLTRWIRSESGRKLTRRIPASVVFAVAAYQSYWHTVEVTGGVGESAVTAHIMPLSVDGLMIVAARYISEARTRWGKALSFVAFLLGIVATLTANVMAAEPFLFARLVAVWPAVALVFTAGMLHWGEMRPRTRTQRRTTTVKPLRAIS